MTQIIFSAEAFDKIDGEQNRFATCCALSRLVRTINRHRSEDPPNPVAVALYHYTKGERVGTRDTEEPAPGNGEAGNGRPADED